jgi:hypothetical protein
MIRTNQERIETKMDATQEKMDTWIADMKDGRKERMACKEMTDANLEKMEPYPGEKEVVAEQQENPNEKIAFLSLKACRNKRMTYQEATEANPEKMEPTDRTIAVLERVEAMDLKANPEELEPKSEHREAPEEDAIVKTVKGWKKRHRNQHLAAGQRREPKVT